MKRAIWCGVTLAVVCGVIAGWMLLRIREQKSELSQARIEKVTSVEEDPEWRRLIGDPSRARQRPMIVLQVSSEGEVRTGDGMLLEDDAAIRSHVAGRKAAMAEEEWAPQIHLEGDKNSLFRHTRRIIRATVDAGVTEVVFVPLSKPVEKREESDLEMTLPGSIPEDEAAMLTPLLVSIDAKGAVFVGRGPMREEVDGADAGRDLPLLRERLAVWGKLGKVHGTRAVAQLRVHEDTPQERVVDVLNALAKEEITKVTLADFIDEEE